MSDIGIALALVVVAVALSAYQRLKLEGELVVATVRALVQLGAVAAVINAVFGSVGLSVLFLSVMVAAASWTSARRLAGVRGAPWLAAAAICAGSVLAVAVLFGAGVFELKGRFLIPIAGMLIGNSMTAVSLAGARLRDDLNTRRLEVEARLALGVTASEAMRPLTRKAAASALIPTIDSTKNLGLIFLPGAFVGMMLGGASPADAATVQLVVMFMLLGAISVAAMVATALVARSFVGAGQRIVLEIPD